MKEEEEQQDDQTQEEEKEEQDGQEQEEGQEEGVRLGVLVSGTRFSCRFIPRIASREIVLAASTRPGRVVLG